MCHRSHENFVLARTVMLLCIRDKVITDLAKDPGAPPDTLMKLKYEELRITCQSGSHNLHSDMNDREPEVFHTDCMKSHMHVWIKTFFKPCPALMWVALKVVLLSCSASVCEHNWSIQKACRVSRSHLHQLEVGTTSGDV